MSRSPRWPGSSSAAFSGPSASSSFARQSFASKTPIRMCRPLKTARQSHGSHLSGRVVYQRELGGQRPGVDEGVDAGRVGLQHRPRLVVQVLVVEPDGRADLEPAHLHVLLQDVGARVLRPSAVGHQAVVLHVPQPVLCGGEGLSEEGVTGGAGPHVGNAVRVAVDVHRALQSVHGHGPG